MNCATVLVLTPQSGQPIEVANEYKKFKFAGIRTKVGYPTASWLSLSQ